MKRNVSVVRFKFLCNILISGNIIKEMPGSVASGTHSTKVVICPILFYFFEYPVNHSYLLLYIYSVCFCSNLTFLFSASSLGAL